jgi:hypothetical protein
MRRVGLGCVGSVLLLIVLGWALSGPAHDADGRGRLSPSRDARHRRQRTDPNDEAARHDLRGA